MDKIRIIFLCHLIPFLLLLISFSFILTQNIINILFYSENSKDIIAEKYIYEQFSHEVYSNINSRIYYNIEKKSQKCDEGSEIIKFPLKFDYFYDCVDIKNNEIDKKECQDKITSASLCCEPNCCRDYVFEKEQYHSCTNKINFNDNDSRKYICSTSSVYNGKFYYINQDIYCAKRYNKNYEELLLEVNSDNNCQNTIEFDSKGHRLCDNDNLSDNGKIIVQNIFSVVEPEYIDIKNSLRIDILLNKKADEAKISKEIKKLNEISSKNIKDAFFEKEEKSAKINYYSSYQNFDMNELISGNEIIFEKYKNNDYAKSGSINWYTRDYIGFGTYHDLTKFKEYFDENDDKNNCLYKLSTSNLTFGISIASIILIFIFIVSIVIYLLYLFKNMKERDINLIPYKNIRIFFIIVSSIDFIFFLIIYLVCFIFKYDYIDIDMEIFFHHVLEKYNKRRYQVYLLCGFIIAAINIIFCSFLFFFVECIKSNASLNSRPINILVAKFRLDEGNCEHKIKIDKNKKLKDYINKMENILERCRNCKNVYLGVGIDNIYLNNENLNLEQNIKKINIDENSCMIIKDD